MYETPIVEEKSREQEHEDQPSIDRVQPSGGPIPNSKGSEGACLVRVHRRFDPLFAVWHWREINRSLHNF